MDRRVIEQKLETLRYCVQRVAQRCPDDPNQLQQDPDTQDIIALNLSRAVQQSPKATHRTCMSRKHPNHPVIARSKATKRSPKATHFPGAPP